MTQQVVKPEDNKTTVLAAPAADEPPQDSGSSLKLQRIVMIAAGGLIALLVLIFVLALLIARGDVDQLAPIIEIVRDLVIIFLALEGILIIMALAVLILQVARLINLLQNEVGPVLKNTQETIKTAKGTVDFVGDTVVEPIIQVSAFVSGVSVLLGNAFGLRRAFKRPQPETKESSSGTPS
jgi:hypothetical protein